MQHFPLMLIFQRELSQMGLTKDTALELCEGPGLCSHGASSPLGAHELVMSVTFISLSAHVLLLNYVSNAATK